MRVTLPSGARAFLDFLLPNPCLGCGLAGRRVGSLGLCLPCLGRLRRVQGDFLVQLRRDQEVFAVYWYGPPLDGVLRALKFRRLDYLGRGLGEVLAAELRGVDLGCDVVAPVPLHWWRRWRRGFDQAERIACGAARALGLPAERLVRRVRATAPQTGLGRRARQQNPVAAFEVRFRGAVAGRTVLLVDDVVTTGATLRAAAGCLRRAGAARVVAAAIARTPLL